MKVLLLLAPIISFAIARKAPKIQEHEVPAPLASVLQAKCDGLPYLTYFDRITLTCVYGIPNTKSCKDVKLPYMKRKKSVALSRNSLRNVERIKKKASEVCYLTFNGECDRGVQVGSRCLTSEKPETFRNAAKHCADKGETLFVPHSDDDLQNLLYSLKKEHPGASKVWIGLATSGGRWVNHDRSRVNFYRWTPKKKFSKKYAAIVRPVTKKNSLAGYVSTDLLDKKLPFFCSKPLDSQYVWNINSTEEYLPPCKTSPVPLSHIAFIMDCSGSVSKAQWNQIINYVKSAGTVLNSTTTKVFFASFSNQTQQWYKLERGWNQQSFNAAVPTKYFGGGTDVAVGLNTARYVLQNQDEASTLRVIVLVTDLFRGKGVVDVATQAKTFGTKIVGVGVGNVSLIDMRHIVSPPDSLNYIPISQPFLNLTIVEKAIKPQVICEDDPRPKCTTTPVPLSHFAFIMDCSGSVSKTQWADMVKFVRGTSTMLNSTTTKIFFNSFSNKLHQWNYLQRGWNQQMFNNSVPSNYFAGGTNVEIALNSARNVLNEDKESTLKVIVAVTDLFEGKNVIKTAEQIRASGITIVGVGVGKVNLVEMKKIVSAPDVLNYITVSKNFNTLAVFDNATKPVTVCETKMKL